MMGCRLFTLALGAFAFEAFADGASFVVDPELGEPFLVQYFLTKADTAEYQATLIDYPWKHETSPKASVLYIHGFNDYFFQKELAQKVDSAGYSFYAIDLHKYGRSYREGERMGEMHDLSEYFPELDSALSRIRGKDHAPVAIIAHSTGGLIAALYARNRENGQGISAMVLNSPFLDMNLNFFMELIVPAASFVGGFFPSFEIPRGNNTCYSESLHKDFKGSWNFDLRKKIYESIPINLEWLRAIHEGHVAVQEGMDLSTPILVMHSDCSTREDECVEEYSHCDGVLDIEDIDRYGRNLGKNVQVDTIEGGIHDLYLSKLPARESAYQATLKFLDENIR